MKNAKYRGTNQRQIHMTSRDRNVAFGFFIFAAVAMNCIFVGYLAVTNINLRRETRALRENSTRNAETVRELQSELLHMKERVTASHFASSPREMLPENLPNSLKKDRAKDAPAEPRRAIDAQQNQNQDWSPPADFTEKEQEQTASSDPNFLD